VWSRLQNKTPKDGWNQKALAEVFSPDWIFGDEQKPRAWREGRFRVFGVVHEIEVADDLSWKWERFWSIFKLPPYRGFQREPLTSIRCVEKGSLTVLALICQCPHASDRDQRPYAWLTEDLVALVLDANFNEFAVKMRGQRRFSILRLSGNPKIGA
jgi:hypothetical protein